MGCIDSSSDWGRSEEETDRGRANMLARMLCGLCARVEAYEAEQTCPPELISFDTELAKWWVNHKESDARRREQEGAKRRDARDRAWAMNKLTPRERELLGIK
jgi:hypothetical protein